MSFPLPPDESERLVALERYDLDDIGPMPLLERVARIAMQVIDTPIALVTLVRESDQRFLACYGLDRDGTSRDESFCTHSLVDNEALVVRDAQADPRFADNPLVVGEPGIRFYAGAPLVTEDGHGLGTLCVIDTEPRDAIDPSHLEILEMLAAIGMDALEQRFHALSLMDALERIRSTVSHMEKTSKS